MSLQDPKVYEYNVYARINTTNIQTFNPEKEI